MATDIAEIKAEQSHQARQLDAIAKDMYRFAGDLYELRLDFRGFRGDHPRLTATDWKVGMVFQAFELHTKCWIKIQNLG